jgi:hypothetical protein
MCRLIRLIRLFALTSTALLLFSVTSMIFAGQRVVVVGRAISQSPELQSALHDAGYDLEVVVTPQFQASWTLLRIPGL